MQIRQKKAVIVKKIQEKNAETLFEIVVSIALFSVVLLMVAGMFGMANRVTQQNLKIDEAFDEAITKIVTETDIEESNTVKQSIVFRDPDGNAASYQVERIKAGGFYKFREPAE